jgi:hypothetical protein
MKASSIFRFVSLVVALSALSCLSFVSAVAQDVGADVGGGAGIFRPRNPETKRRTSRPATPVTKRGATSRPVAPTNAANAAM